MPPFIAIWNTANHVRAWRSASGIRQALEPAIMLVVMFVAGVVNGTYIQYHLNAAWDSASSVARSDDPSAAAHAPDAADDLTGYSLVDRDVALAPRADVLRVRPDHPVVGVLLAHVGRPPGHPGDREDRRHEVRRDAERVVDAGGVEVDVGVQPLLLARPSSISSEISYHAGRRGARPPRGRAASGRRPRVLVLYTACPNPMIFCLCARRSCT